MKVDNISPWIFSSFPLVSLIVPASGQQERGLPLAVKSSTGKWEIAPLKHLVTHEYIGQSLVDAVDWTRSGAVTPVDNRRHCRLCWAFPIMGSSENTWFIATCSLSPLSEQQLTD